jgi:hypothetical protein
VRPTSSCSGGVLEADRGCDERMLPPARCGVMTWWVQDSSAPVGLADDDSGIVAFRQECSTTPNVLGVGSLSRDKGSPRPPQAPTNSRQIQHTAERSGLTGRLGEHAAGRGANLVAVVLEAGRAVELVRVWPGGGYRLERSLKNRHGTTICPRCPSPPSRRLPRSQRTVQARLFDPRPYQWPPPPGEGVAR